MSKSIPLQLLFFISLFFFCHYPTNTILAAAVPVEKTVTKQQHKKRFKRFKRKKRQHKSHKLMTNNQINPLPWIILAWYLIFLSLLIIGIALAITPMWIVAIIGLGLPLLAVGIFGIWLIADLNSASF